MKFITVTRQQMEACGRALPKRVYCCQHCRAVYSHDQAYHHACQLVRHV